MKFLGFIYLGTPVLEMAFYFALAVVSIVLFRSMEGIVWCTLVGLELGFFYIVLFILL